MTTERPNVLVFAPHQDDESIGCGGTLALLTDRGFQVRVVHIFAGDSSGGGDRSGITGTRQSEAAAACEVLGVELGRNFGFPDRETIDTTILLWRMISAIREWHPTLLFAPHADEKDREHQVVSECCWDARWLARTEAFPELGPPKRGDDVLLFYEVWTPLTAPALRLDITAFADRKREAIDCHRSQLRDTSWREGAMGLASYRGTTLGGRGLAEAFASRETDLSVLSRIFYQRPSENE